MSKRADEDAELGFTPGSGNVFADLGLPEPDELLAKARLAAAIEETIRNRGLTQAEAGEIIGVDQGTVSKLARGRLDGFSQERLIRYLTALGNDVDIVIRHPESYDSVGQLRVRGPR